MKVLLERSLPSTPTLTESFGISLFTYQGILSMHKGGAWNLGLSPSVKKKKDPFIFVLSTS